MASVYLGCVVQDAISDTLRDLNGELQKYKQNTVEALDAIKPQLDQLSASSKQTATATIGTAVSDNQVAWSAKDAGTAGNNITITYIFLGPQVVGGAFVARPPSASITSGSNIVVVIASDATGNIDATYPVSACITPWLADPDVADLVTAAVVGAGTGLPEPVTATPLTGGEGTPITDAEAAGDDISKIFGQSSYQDLLRSVDIPVIESDEDARQYLSTSDDYLVINGQLLIVEGTNLVGISKIYEATGNDLTQTRTILTNMALTDNQNTVNLVTTKNVSISSVQWVCGELETLTTVTEQYAAFNESVVTTATEQTGRDLTALNPFIFWSVSVQTSQKNNDRLVSWNIPEGYRGDILAGQTPSEQPDGYQLAIPEVYTVEDPELFAKLGFTDAELGELLAAGVDGIRVPKDVSILDRTSALSNLIKNDNGLLDNGMASKVSKALSSMKAVDFTKSTDGSGLAKELANRGKACARQGRFFEESKANQTQLSGTDFNLDVDVQADLDLLPDVDFPNVPSPDLPDYSAQVESAFAALSSVSNTVNEVFDVQIDAVKGIFGPVLDKLQNLSSLTDNLLNNNLADCLLGTGSDALGLPELPELGSGTTPGIDIPDVLGGLPIPTSLLGDAMGEFSATLDTGITAAFESVMKLVETPLCIVQTLLASINGFDLGGLENPCKEEKDSDTQCPPQETQEIADESTDISEAMETIPRLDNLPTTDPVETTTEDIQHFTGEVEETTTSTVEDIERGVKEVMEDIQKSLDSKMELVSLITDAVKKLTNDAGETRQNEEEDSAEAAGCGSATLGPFTDSISNYIG